jgi:hypothetical protein
MVLDDMAQNKFAIYFFSDNVEGEGDVHLGPFNTRTFVHWMQTWDMGCFQTTGPITSLRTQREIQGWMFIPHWKTINKAIKAAREEYLQHIKELNEHEKIKQSGQATRKEHADESKALTCTLVSQWDADLSLTDTTQG